MAGIDSFKAINKGENPRVGRNVIVIGCGNAGMDAAAGAYAMGAESDLHRRAETGGLCP
ncbi:MAG: hypothetical protein ACLT2T_13535 [Bilophila wadsworthia]